MKPVRRHERERQQGIGVEIPVSRLSERRSGQRPSQPWRHPRAPCSPSLAGRRPVPQHGGGSRWRLPRVTGARGRGS